MWARWAALTVWAGVALSALFWGLRLFAKGPPVPADVVQAGAGAAAGGDLARVLGAALVPVAGPVAAAPPEASRYQLLGVVAPRGVVAGAGVALIAVDGKPARAYRVGARVDGDTVLQRVRQRAAELGTEGAPASLVLELPPLPPAATGTPTAAVPDAPQAMLARPPPPPGLPPTFQPNFAPNPRSGLPGFPGAAINTLPMQPARPPVRQPQGVPAGESGSEGHGDPATR